MASVTEPIANDVAEAASGRFRRIAWRLIKAALFVVLAVLAVQAVSAHSDELAGASDYLDNLHWFWVPFAIGAEAISMFCFMALQRRLLNAGGLRVPVGPLTVITLAGNAMANTLPGGGAFATVFAYRQYRRRGADETLAAWTLVMVTILTGVTLAAIAAAGLAIAGNEGPASGLGVLLAFLIAGPIVVVAVLLHPQLLATVLRPPLRGIHHLTGFPRREPTDLLDVVVARLQAVRPRFPDWVAAIGWSIANWAADCTCLVAAFAAVGSPVPWRGLLLAYGAAQTAANLPITPGGLGVVEGSLTVALVAFGGSTAATVAAVVLYRLLSFWALLPVGWTAWGGLRLQARVSDRLEGRR